VKPAEATALVIDDGLFVHVARSLAKGFGKVLYHLALRSASPKAKWDFIGSGFPDLERSTNLYSAAKRADIIISPDVYTADLADHFRDLGKPVFGAGMAGASIETNRVKTRDLVRNAGLPLPKAEVVTGVDRLESRLRQLENKWIKVLTYRGDVETFHHLDWFRTKPKLRKIAADLGPAGSEVVFLVEDPIEGVEVGLDVAVVNGEYPPTVSYGYEDKGTGYFGIVCAFKDLPSPIKEVCTKFQPVLKERKYTGWFSAEIRVTKDGTPFFTDPCMRPGSPPSESYMDLFANWPDFVLSAAQGKLIDLEPVAGYSAQIQLTSEEGKEDHLAWEIPKHVAPYVKLHQWARRNGIDYTVPVGESLMGSVVGLHDKDCHAAADLAKERVHEVKAYALDFDEATFEVLGEMIEKGKKHKVSW
jgi:hypothetical protein